jgi:DNA polymerase-3 subunit delta
MKVSAKALGSQLKKGLAPLYAIHGAEPLSALEAADRLREAARAQGYSERETFVAEPGCDWGRLGASGANLSLFATRRLFEIRIASGKPGAEGGRALEAWCAKLPEDTLTLVTLPELDWQQLKSAWFGALDAAGVVVEAKPVSREELPEWLAERLARGGQRASLETLEWLADRVEGNLLAAKQEIEKLSLLLPPGEVTLEMIRGAVTDVSRFERDGLVAAIHAGDCARIARIIPALRAEGEPLPLLLWTLAEELRLLLALAAGQRPRRYLTPDRTQALARTARRLPRASFAQELLRAHRIDRMIKGVETGNPWDEVLEFALALAGGPVLESASPS